MNLMYDQIILKIISHHLTDPAEFKLYFLGCSHSCLSYCNLACICKCTCTDMLVLFDWHFLPSTLLLQSSWQHLLWNMERIAWITTILHIHILCCWLRLTRSGLYFVCTPCYSLVYYCNISTDVIKETIYYVYLYFIQNFTVSNNSGEKAV